MGRMQPPRKSCCLSCHNTQLISLPFSRWILLTSSRRRSAKVGRTGLCPQSRPAAWGCTSSSMQQGVPQHMAGSLLKSYDNCTPRITMCAYQQAFSFNSYWLPYVMNTCSGGLHLSLHYFYAAFHLTALFPSEVKIPALFLFLYKFIAPPICSFFSCTFKQTKLYLVRRSLMQSVPWCFLSLSTSFHVFLKVFLATAARWCLCWGVLDNS